jgi:hypothetical protein
MLSVCVREREGGRVERGIERERGERGIERERDLKYLAQVTILTTTSVNFHRNVERNGQTIDWKM